MNRIFFLMFVSAILISLKSNQVFGRPKSFELQTRSNCGNGECLKSSYRWVDGLEEKPQDSFDLLKTMVQSRYSQPYIDYFLKSKASKQDTDANLSIENNDQEIAPENNVFQLLQKPSNDIQDSWQENGNIVTDNSNNIVDSNEFLEENMTSLAKRNFYRNQIDYDAFLTLAGLNRNFSLANLKHTRGHAIPLREKFTNVERMRCPCGCAEKWLDLGKHYFPRHHLSYQCDTSSCSPPPYLCIGKLFKIWVLKKREGKDPVGERYISNLPEPFRKDYLFVEQMIPVACECTN